MGANAQTSVPTFTAGEVLTAANQNISAGTGVPVFATTVTRDAAFGGTGEKVLAEGQLAYIEADNVVQYYDGSNWQAIGTTPGLVCVKAETSFSASSSVTADSVFTSTYTNYLVIINWTATGGELRMKLRASGTSTSTNYNWQRTQVNAASLSGSAASTGESAYVGPNTGGSFQASGNYYINSPQLAQVTTIQSSYAWHNAGYTTPTTYQTAGNQNSSTQFDGIEFAPLSGTVTGNYAIYGFSKTV